MKLVAAVVQDSDAGRVLDALLAQELRATRVNASGGFLRRTNALLLVAVDDARVDETIDLIGAHSESRTEMVSNLPAFLGFVGGSSGKEVRIGGAIVFVMPIERFERD